MSSTTHRIRRIALVAVLLSVALVPAIAQNGNVGSSGGQFGAPSGGRGPFGPRPGDGGLAIERLDRQLGFTDAQKSQIQTLLMQQRDGLKSTFDTLRQAQQTLDTAVMQTPEDDAALQAQVTALSALQAQIALARAQTEAKIYQLLTANQKQELQQLLAQMQQRRQQGRGSPGR